MAIRKGVDAAERILLSESNPGHANNLLIWPARKFGAATGAKLVSIFPENETRGFGPNIHSVYVLFDGHDGQPLCVITGESFTRYKTAADSALGASFLARPDCEVLAVAGAGAQAAVHIQLLCAVRPSTRRVFLWNRTFAKAERLAGSLGLRGVDVIAHEDLGEAVRAADIVTCLTSTMSPILQGAWLKPGTHVDLVGSFTPEMREADDETIRRGRLFVDSRRFVHNGPSVAVNVAADLSHTQSTRRPLK